MQGIHFFDEDEIRRMTRLDRVRHFRDDLGYAEDAATFLAENIEHTDKLKQTHHIKSVAYDYSAEKFDVEIAYHSRIFLE